MRSECHILIFHFSLLTFHFNSQPQSQPKLYLLVGPLVFVINIVDVLQADIISSVYPQEVEVELPAEYHG